MSFRWMLIAAFVVSLAFALPQSRLVQAQTSTGTISGVVTDASGGVVANAEAKATNDATGQTWTAPSGSAGEFQLQNLPAGSYTVEVSAAGFQVFHANKIGVSSGSAYNLPVRLVVESARKVVIVKGEVADDYKPANVAVGNLDNQPLQELPLSALVVTRSLLDDQQARLLSDVAKNDASVGEDYAPVGYYQDFEIRGFPLDLASGIKINGLSAAGEQLIALENKDAVEFLHGVDSDEVGVASGGGLVNYVTKRPAGVRTLNLATDQRGTLYAGVDLGGFLGAQQQFGVRANLAGEDIKSYVHGADGTREFGAVAADWKITSNTFLKGDFEYQHLVERSVGGYQLLGGTTVPVDVSPDVMLGYQWWAKPNTFDVFNTSLRLDHNLSTNWRFFVSAGLSHSLIDDNIAWPYGCYYAPSCASGNTPPYFFSPTGDYDVYDWRSPGELYINDQFEAILQGQVKTGPVTNDVAIGTSLQRHSVNLPTPVDAYVGTENIYQPEQTFPPSTQQPGPVTLAEDTHQYALIVADHLHLPKRIDVSVGGQYDALRDHNFSQPNPPGPVPFITDHNLWLPQYALSYRPIPKILLYGNYSVALSLGLQAPFWSSNGSVFLDPFFTRQAEVGLKYTPGSRILLTAALFRMRAPFFYPRPDTTDNLTTFVSDGHETHRGLELNAQGKVKEWLRLTGSAAFLSAVSSGSSTPDFNGKQVINVPHFRTSWFADIDVPFISGLHLLPGWSYTGPKEATRDDTVSVPGYNLFNIGARYTPSGEWKKVTFRLFADNVMNKRYWKDTGASYGDTFLHLGAPTTVRLSAQYNF
ncbi:MAG TPA: TonB-dependent receptor [Candidatus Acidoferrum sp.]|nr:TonB-dependent receptor [Candidatus Acidoferrum sp.]